MKARWLYPLVPCCWPAARSGPTTSGRQCRCPASIAGAADSTAASLADTKWPDLFQDDTLKQLIATALEHNFDLAHGLRAR